ncbi:hypothetical protein [Lachnoclostridium sp. Marseille-P6806]|uniref:hypothetical protein n=1 Tax=Lachnoclostridium sp. Marseille-P6806 TaxID=2364793 RepID=UPI00102FAE35|nr:hypothetical protein [Lachnoclostridium sp. Marseille-P6806]
MYECPDCGAALRFDIPLQKLKCDYCGGEYDPYAYKTGKEAEEQDSFGATVYTCTQCGAELVSTDSSATGFCSYCGASAVLQSRLTTEKKPETIIPFMVSKEQCKKLFAKKTRFALYAPKEYRDPAFVERFRGIYIPYWLYDVSFNKQVELPAVKEYRRGDYVYTENYRTVQTIEGSCDGTAYDASSSFDDRIADQIAPFHAGKMKPFHPSFLCGFYADTSDVPEETYRQQAKDRAMDEAMDRVQAGMAKQGLTAKLPAGSAAREQLLGARCDGGRAAMFPVWFLTWRKDGRIAYAIVNGETGKVTMDLPVDLKRYALGTGLMAVLLFAAMSFTVAMTAPTALFWSAFLALASGVLFRMEMRAIVRRERHEDDAGFFAAGRQLSGAKAENGAPPGGADAGARRGTGERTGAEIFAGGMNIGKYLLSRGVEIFILLYALSAGSKLFSGSSPASGAATGCGLLLLAGTAVFAVTASYMKKVTEKNMLLQAAGAWFGLAVAFVICYIEPVEDWKYYAGCIVCLAAVAVTCVGLILKYNILSTRPIPTFFDRKGGNDSAKE